MATWNVATISPPALSAWSGAARTSQLCKPTGTAPKAKPQSATAIAATEAEAPNASSEAAATVQSAEAPGRRLP